MSLIKKMYVGRRSIHCTVTVQEISKAVKPRKLNPRLDVRNHSPDGFEWGYGGSGPAQLALAILCEHFGDKVLAQAWYQQFKFRVIAAIKSDEFVFTTDEITRELGLLGYKGEEDGKENRAE